MTKRNIRFNPKLTPEEREKAAEDAARTRARLAELSYIKPTRTWTDNPVPRPMNPDGSYEPTAYERWKAEKKRLKAEAAAEKPADEGGTES